MDAAGSVVDSLVIRDGRVAFAGRRGDINPAPREPTLDLGGRAVLPGLVDGHGHLMLLARARLELNLTTASSEDEIARMVAAAAARLRPGEWITGRGWDQTRWAGQAYPGRAALDRAAPVHPVALSPDGNVLAVCNLPDYRVELFDVSGGIPMPLGDVPVGVDPVSLRFRTTNELWVVNHISSSINVIDLSLAA